MRTKANSRMPWITIIVVRMANQIMRVPSAMTIDHAANYFKHGYRYSGD